MKSSTSGTQRAHMMIYNNYNCTDDVVIGYEMTT